MPDIAASRPASGAPVESAWGGQVHDALEGVQSGIATCAISAAAQGDGVVTFPRAYATPPDVVVSVRTVTSLYYAIAHSVTTTGFTARAVHRDGTSTTTSIQVTYIAVGTPA